jgi:hypothetical protein
MRSWQQLVFVVVSLSTCLASSDVPAYIGARVHLHGRWFICHSIPETLLLLGQTLANMSCVVAAGFKKRQMLNGREGVVDEPDSRKPGRWLVQLRTLDGLRDGEPMSLPASKLEVISGPQPTGPHSAQVRDAKHIHTHGQQAGAGVHSASAYQHADIQMLLLIASTSCRVGAQWSPFASALLCRHMGKQGASSRCLSGQGYRTTGSVVSL